MTQPNLLRGLRLNCFLAGMLPAFTAAIACFAIGLWVQTWHQNSQLASARMALKGYIAGLPINDKGAQDSSPANSIPSLNLDRLLAAQSWWRGIQQLTIDGEGTVTVLAEHGTLNLDHDNIPPQLTWAATTPQAWWGMDDRIRTAAAKLGSDGTLQTIIYAEAQAKPWPTLLWFTLASIGIAIFGLLMAWYLVRRIYLPVEALSQQALAAVSGQVTAPKRSSLETQAFASAISVLTESFVVRQMEATHIAQDYASGETQNNTPPVDKDTATH